MKTEMNTVKVRKTEELEAEQLGAHIGEIVRLHGSIYKIRKMSSFAFVLLRTKRQMVQCVYEPAYARFALEELKEEACVRFTAEVIREERSRSGYDLHLLDVEILSEPEEVPPVVINQKRVNTSIENLLDYRPITLRNEKERAVFPNSGQDLSGVPRISGWTALHRNPHTEARSSGAEGRLISSPCRISANRHIWRRARSLQADDGRRLRACLRDRTGLPGGEARHGASSERIYKRGL